MKNKLLELKEYVNSFNTNKKLVIFGAGDYGRRALKVLKEYGFDVESFYDNDKLKIGKKIDDLIILDPNTISGNQIILIASTWSNQIIEQLKSNIKFNGKFYILDPWFQIMDTSISELDLEKSYNFYNKLNDKHSKEVFDNLINSRMLIENFKKSNYEQYYNQNCQPENGDVLIDGGAFVGDTIISLNRTKLEKLKIYSFEPDNNNYDRLKFEAEKSRFLVTTINLGLWSHKTELRFKSSDEIVGYGCKIEEEGDIIINTTSIDEYCSLNNIVPTFIKLDVEGAEAETIEGAKNIIRKFKPKLAISVYHKYKDIWEIPFQIDEICNEYDFYLGHHRTDWFETILYCNPKKQGN
ncbi:MAG: FkbM family methyltransferase [Aliarcobacter skirrowii]|uniref:FkbM family methyltransferase n=1 Tax=Aliarcobacter skirrowii TaxID=28200 RepID=UPI0024300080|nr:FkbM family methyltransferase [Aliarcobacter skirrowii]MDD2509189.1 FkbM family methyltransferase [Aliarcobacter skirrowii]MDD3497457.1 FkbM family methyltransferase [Aliarcobacter skirrowii]